jgi:pimeloyl-ACP methyl ester carboxylesterase
MNIKKSFKFLSIIFLILIFIVIYNSIYFDIPKNEIISKHAKGASEFIELDDGSLIHIRDEGNKNGKIIVMVHGFNGSLFNYEPLIPYLSERYRILSLDLPAHGLTGAVKSDIYSHEAFENVIKEVVKIQGIDEFYLIGHSMGGMIAWRYALNNMKQIKGLVIIGSPFIGNEKEYNDFQSVNAPPAAFKLLDTALFREMLGYVTPRLLIKEGISQTIYDQSIVNHDLVDQFHDIILMDGTREAIGKLIISHEDNFIADPTILRKINIPTLILHGEEDNLVDIRFVSHFVEQIPNVKLISYPRVGHMPPMEIPIQLSKDIQNFVN